jgi:ssDNA-binding Zn-finger/Zn-ribbon topoisomerase 1
MSGTKDHCYRHGCDYPYGRSCPECRAEEEAEDRQRIQDTLEQIAASQVDTSDLAYRLNNPGEYTCPACSYTTLQFLAKRCPKCHADVDDLDSGYWDRVIARKKTEAVEKARFEKEMADKKARLEQETARADKQARNEGQESIRRENHFLGCFVAVALLVASIVLGVAWLADQTKKQTQPTSSGSDSSSTRRDYTAPANVMPAPEQIVDRGACPFEGCMYGEQWMARRDVIVYAKAPNALGVASSSLEQKAVVHTKDWVTTETGIVLAQRHEGLIGQATTLGAAVVNGPLLRRGEKIYLYSYLGENCWNSWTDGGFLVVCSPESPSVNPQQEWWIQIRLADGSRAWTNSSVSFATQGRMNSEIGETIRDSKSTLPEKLTRIDVLIKEGADLNGEADKYGTSAIEAAVEANDISVMKELMLRGMNVRSIKPCPAFWEAQHALESGGDVMLDFLLENGMQLSCLAEPPLHTFLGFGVSGKDYPVAQAIKVAELLVEHGADTAQCDSQGRTIFRALDRARTSVNLAPLKAALTKMLRDQYSVARPGL